MPHTAAIAHQIWDMKYRLKTADGTPVDRTVADTWQRVAEALAAHEADPETWTRRFYAALSDFRFLPAGRILAGAGTDRNVTLFNCFVMGTVPDSLDGIFDQLREAAVTMQQGGGIGYDFSTLRPKGARVESVGADASGPLSFMDVWDAMCRTILSAGARRGAMMGCLRVDHPDIEAFVDAKAEPGRLRMFNLSVLVPDAFMRAVEQDTAWALAFDGTVYRTVRARDLWERIMRATYAYAEPGVIFIDRVNAQNNLYYAETINATNPCGEQPLPPYGACLLGSLNLARFVNRPFEADAVLDEAALAAVVPDAVRLLDNAIDASRFPLDAQAGEARTKRRIGLGITGLADALAMLGVRYASREAVGLLERWLGRIRREAYLASAHLAAEKGPFPLFDREKYLDAPMVRTLDDDVRRAVADNGIRNALLTSIAPTGTTSLFADNVSSGLEPVFSYTYRRAVQQADGGRREEAVADYAWALWRQRNGDAAPPEGVFVTAGDLAPHDHLVMQAAAQKYVDAAISKTINLPADIPFDRFKDVYRQAHALGCKGCTTYRPNPVTGAVLRSGDADEGGGRDAPEGDAEPEGDATGCPDPSLPMARPEVIPGRTYKLRWPDSDHAIYVTINDVVRDGVRRPFEIFINSKNMEHYAWTVALTRMISAVFRRGGDVAFVAEELKAVFDPRGGAWMQGRYVPSVPAAIGDIIERHMVDVGFLPPGGLRALEAGGTAPGSAASAGDPPGAACPRCGQPALVRQEGCDTCTACGHSRCG